jgi:SAM-dependent methyltransferase
MTHVDIIKLNLGCGPSGIEGWINYDWGMLPILSKVPKIRQCLIDFKILPQNYNVDWPKIHLVDIRHKLPLEDGTVDYIYCSHVLEHFKKYETLNILKECQRVLKKDGTIRIVLPDLKYFIDNYKNAEVFNHDFFGYEKDKQGYQNIFIRGHQWMYDEPSFKEVLKTYFDKIEIVKFRKGKVPDLDKLDLKEHSNHSFYIEATK